VDINLLIKEKFGSKRGMLRFFYFQFLLKIGFYRQYKKIDFASVKRLVFICAGNICRSPLAEAVARKNGINSFSFGLDTRGGDPADPRAIDYAIRHQLDLNSHITHTLADYISEVGDLLVVMEPKHIPMLPVACKKLPVTLAGLWLKEPVAYLHDPYNTDLKYFDRCENMVCMAANQLVKRLGFGVK